MFPSFIGIGAQRAGTGWLYRNLMKRPDIWLTPVKELHYFDTLDQSESLSYRLRKASWRRQCTTRILRDCFPRSRGTIRWDLRYFFWRRSDDWYASLFLPTEDQIAGEITPSYSTLDNDKVAHIRKIMPEIKIIFVMRNPIHRAWSHAINRLVRRDKLNFTDIKQEQLIRLIDSDGSRILSDYMRAARIWESHFPTSQIFYGFYDDLVNNPAGLLTDLCTFLCVDPQKLMLEGSLRKQVKPQMGTRYPMPFEVKFHAAKKYHADLVELNGRFGSHAEHWLAGAGSIINTAER